MFFRKIVLLLFILSPGYFHAYCQPGDFCNAVITITRDASNQFRNIRGNIIQKGATTTIWEAGIKVPGSIGTRFVASMGLFYECAFFQSKNKGELKAVYEKYKELLSKCLIPEGYTLSMQPCFYPGLDEYKKLVFMPELKEDAKADTAPPHITLEATYNKEVGQYTIVMYIFEH